MTYRFEWILQDIRNGLELPERWPDGEEEEEEELEYSRWWEEDETVEISNSKRGN
jgi:hypothetical protein